MEAGLTSAARLDRRITLRRKTVTNTGLGMTEAWADLVTIGREALGLYRGIL